MSEGIEANKTTESHRCIICNYYYFLNINSRFQSKKCDGCHDLLMSFNNVEIVFVKGNDYRIHFWYVSKDEVINIMKNSNLKEKSGPLYMKMDKKIIALGDTEIEKKKSHCHKNTILIDDVYIDKMLISNNTSFGKKGFIYFVG